MSRAMRIDARRIATRHPADVSELTRLLDEGVFRAEDVLCIIGKTEGNGGRNDFTRDLAMRAFEDLFGARLGLPPRDVQDRVIFSLSGGCEGVMSPHLVVFARSGERSEVRSPGGRKALAIGTGHTRPFFASEIGRLAQIEETARAIREVVAGLQLDSPADVHLVQMKGAIPEPTKDEKESGIPLRSDMVFSRGASALGAALALGEVASEALSDDMVCRDFESFSSVASCSAKPGLERTEIMVMGNSACWDGDLSIEHGVLRDMLDTETVRDVLRRLDVPIDLQLSPEAALRIVGVFAKSEADPRGTVRGRRHTMLSDDDIPDTRQSRCVLAAVLASVLSDPAVYVSTRAEHHGPSGGGTLAIVARRA